MMEGRRPEIVETLRRRVRAELVPPEGMQNRILRATVSTNERRRRREPAVRFVRFAALGILMLAGAAGATVAVHQVPRIREALFGARTRAMAFT